MHSVPILADRNVRTQRCVLTTFIDFCQVWDVLSNKEVIHIVASAPAKASAARYLTESAVRAWKSKYPTSKIDDCAAVCLFLNIDTSNNSTLGGKEANGTLNQVEGSS